MSLIARDTPQPFQPAVTQRHLEAEVAHCVGGVISPAATERASARDGKAAGVRYIDRQLTPGATGDSPALARYADDLVACCHSRQQAEQVKARLAEWLAPRGLAFNEDKTRIVRLDEEGFDFLGFNLRRYRNGKLLIKPSAKAIKRFRQRLAGEFRALRGANIAAVLARSTRSFGAGSPTTGHVVSVQGVRRAGRPTCGSSPTSGRAGVIRTSRSTGSSTGTTGSSTSSGTTDGCSATAKPAPTYRNSAWTEIARHTLVKGRASPDDPDLAEYWAKRRRKVKPPLDSYTVRLLTRQAGRCTRAGQPPGPRPLHPSPPRAGNGGSKGHQEGDRSGLPSPRQHAQRAARPTNAPRTRAPVSGPEAPPGQQEAPWTTADDPSTPRGLLGPCARNAHARS